MWKYIKSNGFFFFFEVDSKLKEVKWERGGYSILLIVVIFLFVELISCWVDWFCNMLEWNWFIWFILGKFGGVGYWIFLKKVYVLIVVLKN